MAENDIHLTPNFDFDDGCIFDRCEAEKRAFFCSLLGAIHKLYLYIQGKGSKIEEQFMNTQRKNRWSWREGSKCTDSVDVIYGQSHSCGADTYIHKWIPRGLLTLPSISEENNSFSWVPMAIWTDSLGWLVIRKLTRLLTIFEICKFEAVSFHESERITVFVSIIISMGAKLPFKTFDRSYKVFWKTLTSYGWQICGWQLNYFTPDAPNAIQTGARSFTPLSC